MSDEQSGPDRPQPTEAIPTADTTAMPSDPTGAPSGDVSFPPPPASGMDQPWDAPAPPAQPAYQPPPQAYQPPPAQTYPYGQAPPPAPQPYGYGAPPAYATGTPTTNSSALTLTILSGVSIMFCGGLLVIPALVLGIIGLTKQSSEPAESAKFTRWGWIAFAAGWVLSIFLIIAFFAVFIASASDMSGSGI